MTREEGEIPDEGRTRQNPDDGFRAHVKKGHTSKFHTGDRVWFDPGGSRPREGPYLIASVQLNGKYTLCYEDGDNEAVNNGEEVGESQLRRAS